MDRHNRNGSQRDANGNNNTSFFPKAVNEATARSIIQASIPNATAPRRRIPPNHLPANNPPRVNGDLTNFAGQFGRQYDNVAGLGVTGTLGFNFSGGHVGLGQYYPTGGAYLGEPMITVNVRDLTAIKTALGK